MRVETTCSQTCREQKLVLPTHGDETGRVQTVFPEHSPRCLPLTERFGQSTGVPLVLNTSFNLGGEPIVNTPAAVSRFSKSGMDSLILESFIPDKPETEVGHLF